MKDGLLCLARVLIALLFVMTIWVGGPSGGYVDSLGLSPPTFWSPLAITVETVVAVSLILGIATRYGALLGILYVIVATALAHRYWQVPPAAFVAQYTNFSKNLAILGGLILVYVSGAGAISVDHTWSSKRRPSI